MKKLTVTDEYGEPVKLKTVSMRCFQSDRYDVTSYVWIVIGFRVRHGSAAGVVVVVVVFIALPACTSNPVRAKIVGNA